MRIENQMETDSIKTGTFFGLTAREFKYGAAAAGAGFALIMLLRLRFQLSTTASTYIAAPVILAIGFQGFGRQNGMNGWEWVLRKQKMLQGKSLYLYRNEEETEGETDGGSAALRKKRPAVLMILAGIFLLSVLLLWTPSGTGTPATGTDATGTDATATDTRLPEGSTYPSFETGGDSPSGDDREDIPKATELGAWMDGSGEAQILESTGTPEPSIESVTTVPLETTRPPQTTAAPETAKPPETTRTPQTTAVPATKLPETKQQQTAGQKTSAGNSVKAESGTPGKDTVLSKLVLTPEERRVCEQILSGMPGTLTMDSVLADAAAYKARHPEERVLPLFAEVKSSAEYSGYCNTASLSEEELKNAAEQLKSYLIPQTASGYERYGIAVLIEKQAFGYTVYGAAIYTKE